MTFRVRPEAEIDYVESVSYYLTEETPQSAERFTNELDNAYLEIQEAPFRQRVVHYGLREKRVKGFPFAVIYSIEEEEIVVVAIYHDDRKRSRLRERL
jgi:plasmid stabilization system protein ParE